MREILFRGKRQSTGEWVEGCYVFQYGAHSIYLPSVDGKYGFDNYYIDPATVGQYIGRVDMNGKRIFEGDVVEYKGRRYSIVYYAPFSVYMLIGKHGGSNGMYTPLHECIVIGNIHDNPELLEKEAEK